MPTSVRERVRSVFRSLAARISFFVLAATLTSTLAVAGSSAHALRAFLREKVEQKVPAALTQVRDRLELWYAQRSLDAQVFASSTIVLDGLARLARPGSGDPRSRADVEEYLGYVLAGLPQYGSIFVLDREARVVLHVGRAPALPPEPLAELAAADDARVSGVLTDGEQGAVQVVSSAVRSREARPPFTLHAVLPIRALAEQLAAVAPRQGHAFVFDERGALVAGSREALPAERQMPASLEQTGPGEVRDYLAADGRRVVGSALAFPRLGWRLVVEEDYDAAFAPIASILGANVALNLGIVVVLALLAYAVASRLVRPLHALSECAQRLRDGEPGVALPVGSGDDELGILARSFGEMVHSLQRANEKLEQLAITDGLTKIHNHRYFQDQLAREVRRSERTGSPLALVLLDVDDFKALNDRHGHVAGDAVLEGLAALLVGETRDHDLVARYGGEEFAILAPGTDRDGALALAEKLRLAAHRHAFLVPAAAEPISVTVSVGVATYRGDARALFQDADRALYAAKAAGKDCVLAAAP